MSRFLAALALCALGLNINPNTAFARERSTIIKDEPSAYFVGLHILRHRLQTEGRKLSVVEQRQLAVVYLQSFRLNMRTAVHCEKGSKPVEQLRKTINSNYTAYELTVACTMADGKRSGWSKTHDVQFWHSGGIVEGWFCTEWHDGRMGIGMGSSEFVLSEKLYARLAEMTK